MVKEEIVGTYWYVLNAGDWFKATDENGKFCIGLNIDPMYCHKATVSEIIEHFK